MGRGRPGRRARRPRSGTAADPRPRPARSRTAARPRGDGHPAASRAPGCRLRRSVRLRRGSLPDRCTTGRVAGRASRCPYTRAVTDLDVLILHPTPASRADDIEAWVADARAALAERHRLGFLTTGANRATVVAGPPDGRTFGARVAEFVAERRPAGLVVLGSGAIPLATRADRRAF